LNVLVVVRPDTYFSIGAGGVLRVAVEVVKLAFQFLG